MKHINKIFGTKNLVSCLIKGSWILILIMVVSCKKFVDVAPPSNLILQNLVFSNDKTAISAVTGLYSKMAITNLSICNGGLSVYCGLSSDELSNTAANPNYDPFLSNTVTPDNSIINTSFWSGAYRNIYQANAILEGLQQSVSITLPVKNQLTGEAKLVRALNFFYLVNLFGDVPMTLTTNYEINAVMPRTSEIQIYEQIISDLKDAEQLMDEAYQSNLRARPNKWAATALLSRVYLYLGNWAKAESESTSVINSSLYAFETDLSKTFLNSSKEAIWELTRETQNTAEGALFIPASATARPTFTLSPSMLNQFEYGDLRRSSWIRSVTVGMQTYNYPYKYKIRTGSIVTEDLIILRISEQYLIRAEARAQQDERNEAILDLNRIRSRSRALPTAAVPNPVPDLPGTLSKSDILIAVAKERQTELFSEWGHRWFDLKRTGQLDAVLTGLKNGWQSHAALYPIPRLETQYNVFLTQNTGYEK